MHFLTNPCRRGFLKTAAASAILLTVIGTLTADDKLPKQILGGNPAITSSGSNRFYDGHGSYAGQSRASGSSTRLYDRQGRCHGAS